MRININIIIKSTIHSVIIMYFTFYKIAAQQLLLWEGGFTYTDLTAEEVEIYNKVLLTQNYDLVHLMEFGLLATTQSNGEISVQIPGHTCSPVKFKARDVEYESDSLYNWFGTIVPQDSCNCSSGYLLITSGDFGKIGQLAVGWDLYDLIELSSTRYILARYDTVMSEDLEDCPLRYSNIDSHIAEVGASDRNTGNCDVRCLILYTPAALAAAPNIGGITNFSINQINTALKNSAVTPSQLRIVLAGALPLAFTESDDIIADVNAINMDSTSNALRIAMRADIVVLFTNGTSGNYPSFAGFASGIGPNPAFTHAIVQVNRAIGPTYTFSHEVGHLLGARHEISDDANPGIAHAWSFKSCCGHKKTIMHTNSGRGSKVLNYSNPNVHYCGSPTGDAVMADNAATIRAASCTVANFDSSAFGLTARFIGYHDIYACACENTFTVEVEALGGATGGYTFQWYISNDGINWAPYLGYGNYVHVPVPCNVGDRLFVRAVITSSDNQTITVSRVIEAAYEWPGQEFPCARDKNTNVSKTESSIQVFPNPAQNMWTIAYSWPSDQNIQFQLVSLTGQILMKGSSYFNKGDGFFSIANSHLSNGVYFLSIITKGNPIVLKLLK
ncbi:MAG: T9SS type A sorting domain-containing protein [candidate division WOR-3 bacterium]